MAIPSRDWQFCRFCQNQEVEALTLAFTGSEAAADRPSDSALSRAEVLISTALRRVREEKVRPAHQIPAPASTHSPCPLHTARSPKGNWGLHCN